VEVLGEPFSIRDRKIKTALVYQDALSSYLSIPGRSRMKKNIFFLARFEMNSVYGNFIVWD
jgi:hypothetical protein